MSRPNSGASWVDALADIVGAETSTKNASSTGPTNDLRPPARSRLAPFEICA
jgi:hypothetical protein